MVPLEFQGRRSAVSARSRVSSAMACQGGDVPGRALTLAARQAGWLVVPAQPARPKLKAIPVLVPGTTSIHSSSHNPATKMAARFL